MNIHIRWDGPYTYKEVLGFDGNADYGLYLITGLHPSYGYGALCYIGMADQETFSKRLRQGDHNWQGDMVWGDNTAHLRYYLGRVHKTTNTKPRADKWSTMIKQAERLLIAAHLPSWNSQGIRGIKEEKAKEFDDIHVFNWGQYATLFPEVSGARHSHGLFQSIEEEPMIDK